MSAETEALVQGIIATHRNVQGAALPILQAVQEAIGYVPEDAIPAIAEALNVTRAEMHGVVTFYHDFRREAAGRHVLKLCRAEACQSAGGNIISERIRRKLGIGFRNFGGRASDARRRLLPRPVRHRSFRHARRQGDRADRS